MKNLMNRFKKYGWIILALTAAGTALFYVYANKKAQSYTATVMITYNNGTTGQNPDGTDIDSSEIKSSYITGRAIKSLGLDLNADSVAGQLTVNPVVSEEEEALYLSKLEHGEDYEVKTDQYTVTLTADASFGEAYAKNMLSQVMAEYYEYYAEKYVDTIGATNNLDGVLDKGYDYLEIMDLTDESLSETLETLSDKVSANDSFRSNTTGMSFSDLYKEFSFYRSYAAKITAKILNQKVTKDRDVLLAKYQKKNSDMALETSANKKKIENLKEVIGAYVDMMEESGNTSFITEDILQEVYDEYGHDGNSDKTTSYDELMEDYVNTRTGCEKNDIETAYNEYILDTFADAEESASEETQSEVLEMITALLEKTEELFEKFEQTNADYNRYLGSQHVKPLSSVFTQKKLSVKKYTVLVLAAVLFLSTAGFLVVSRLLDIFEEAKKKLLYEEKS